MQTSVQQITAPFMRFAIGFDIQFEQRKLASLLVGSSGVVMKLTHNKDLVVGKQLSRIMEQYNKLLSLLRENFRHLRSREDLERSVKLNEDGFFLSLYKLICDA